MSLFEEQVLIVAERSNPVYFALSFDLCPRYLAGQVEWLSWKLTHAADTLQIRQSRIAKTFYFFEIRFVIFSQTAPPMILLVLLYTPNCPTAFGIYHGRFELMASVA